jgi:hypothetical protein
MRLSPLFRHLPRHGRDSHGEHIGCMGRSKLFGGAILSTKECQTRFCAAWQAVISDAYTSREPELRYGTQCARWSTLYSNIACFIAGDPAHLLNALEFLERGRKGMELIACKECRRSLADWGECIRAAIKTIPKFSTLRWHGIGYSRISHSVFGDNMESIFYGPPSAQNVQATSQIHSR